MCSSVCVLVDSPTTRQRPLPLSTVELQKRAARFLHMSSETTMRVAEELYTKGFISYPRCFG
jgi:DNA topoisomerase-3